MINDGILRRDTEEYYYIYRLKMGDHTQTGIVVAGSIEAYKKNFIRRHEYTRSDKETDRVRQIDAVNAQTGPVLTIHKSNNLLERVIERTVCYDADYHVIGVGKVEHTLWVVRDAFDIKEITRAFEKIGVIYIADGHQRSAAACRVSESRNKSAKSLSGDRLHNFFLIVSFPESEVKIYEYNRVVKDLNGFSESQFIRKINETFDVEKQTQATRPNARNNFSMYLLK